MKKLIILLLLPLGCLAQNVEKNLFAESEILGLFLSINPTMTDSPELNLEADIIINEWIDGLMSGTDNDLLLDGSAGYMTICNMWDSKDLETRPYYEIILDADLLIIENASGDDILIDILESSRIGIASYTIGKKEEGGLDIYVAIFR